ncbi:DUF5666 domain-containing protein [Nocardia blacklockiae]|uniref:DUF5666 domain-containing protein n=1 Tax=Nocardia blacklockiae TaxID=480036 RepID=UPI00189572A4|nr:DUF5666 domain-containing protein [Nocardia blacklockiae]MBF6175478.1 hypothetical protein [Nocardia blacklockiae]
MTNPSDPWAQRPDSPDAPTEKLGSSGRAEEPTLHTSEYSEAYGQGPDPTVPYPTPDQQTAPYQHAEPYSYFDQQPGPNPTREIPPYDSAWGAYEPGPGYGQQWAGGPPPPNAPTEQLGPTGLPVEPPRRKRTGLWIGLTAAIFVLVVLGGIAAGALLAGNDSSSSTSAAGTTTRPLPTRQPVVPPSGSAGPQQSIPSLPGLGDIDNIGATMGAISTNDGATLTIESLLGSLVTVHTDDKTQVIAAGAGKVADLHPGDMVVVQGDKAPDGTIQAKIIISTSLTPPR